MPKVTDANILVGTSTADDAAAYRIDDERAIVQTLDFITPIVDDPFDYGRIAAANSISDVYAMGGRPLFALNIVCFPSKKISMDILGRILQGGSETAHEAGIEVVGGHSVDDNEPKYGLVVTGMVHPDKILTNAGAKPGDSLVLTKPLGSGILTTGLKKGRLSEKGEKNVVDVMATLNKNAAEALEGLQVNALTDITGFGLLGHLLEMAEGSKTTARVFGSQVPFLDEVSELVTDNVYPGGAKRNLNRVDPAVAWNSGITDQMKIMLSDPQTSGGLLISVAEQDTETLLKRLNDAGTPAAVVIGEITNAAGDPPDNHWIEVA